MDQQHPLKKHYRSFWPIMIIAVLSAIVGGLVVWAAFNSSLADDISSSSIQSFHMRKKSATPPAVSRTAAKQK